jgi:putative endonuclease
MAQHNELGKKGEQEAVNYLQKKGYKILERNYRFMKAEVDIITSKDDVVCAVEVKTRSTPEFGNPQDFIKPKQIQNLVKVLDYYITSRDIDCEARFDVVAIVKNKLGTRIEHLEDAFLYF